MNVLRQMAIGICALFAFLALGARASADDLSSPEEVIRALVRANAQQDLDTMAALMAHDPDTVGYSIDGRQYVGWDPFAREMEQEFADVEKLEIPIIDLKVWTHGDTAWFAMELDYIRYVRTGESLERTLIPLRETGVLEQRDGQWILVSWHESKRRTMKEMTLASPEAGERVASTRAGRVMSAPMDLSGTWLIEEEDKSYTAYLDRQGNGTYTHGGGSFRAVKFFDRKLLGTWHQTENDREGGFEVLFSADGRHARGVWWYTRVGARKNIPPKLHGGTYAWKRVESEPGTTQGRQAPE